MDTFFKKELCLPYLTSWTCKLMGTIQIMMPYSEAAYENLLKSILDIIRALNLLDLPEVIKCKSFFKSLFLSFYVHEKHFKYYRS